jgi:enoyl-CoA hydratase/carnithine racemase
LVGPAYAKEILLTARRFSAEEALHIGLVNRVVPVAELEATVLEVCAMIVDNSPLSIVANKATIDEVSKDAVARDVLRIEELGRICFDSADYAEGRRAFMEKRKPVWSGK